MLWKSTLREIKTSLERYLAIFAIVALGVGFFSGLQVCKPSMIATCESYLSKSNFYDYTLLTSYGVDDKSVEIAKADENVEDAEASRQQDAIVKLSSDKNNEYNYRLISMPVSLNMPQLQGGRMPQAENECVVDGYNTTAERVGEKITISENNTASVKEKFKVKEYTIVGFVSSPIFLDYQRGSTDVGNGELDAFMYVQPSVFDFTYYTDLYVKLKGGKAFFDENASDFLDSKEKAMKALAEKINIARKDTALAEGQKELDDSRAEYEAGLAEYNRERESIYHELGNAEAKLNYMEGYLPAQKADLEKIIGVLQGQLQQVEESISQLQSAIEVLQATIEITPEGDARTYLEQQLANMQSQYNQLLDAKTQLESAIADAQAGVKDVESGKSELKSGWNEYHSGKSEADREFANAKATLDDAKIKLDEAQKMLDDMKTGESYAFTRYDNNGFAVFEENANIVSNIAKIFPVFFFLIAALVCMTTMTRMIDEQRSQIGIMKALGYSNKAILSKYMFYSGSAAFAGSIIGLAIGCRLFPWVIWNAYGMMYDFDHTLDYQFSIPFAILSVFVALLCSMGATWLSCRSDFGVAPAELIRPKTPPAGKRILLERTPLWSKLSFLYKVSFRNIFRYKKRFFMMVLGVCGCTALLVAGMGINSSISKVADNQFDEIQKYDYTVAFTKNMEAVDQAEFTAAGGEDLGSIKYIYQDAVQLEGKDKDIEITLVASDGKDFGKFVDLHDGDKKLDFPGEGEAIICRKLQKHHNVSKGDTLKLRDGMREMEVKVVGVCDNYVHEYVYISSDTYTKGFGRAPEIKMAMVKAPDKATDKAISKKAAELSENNLVAATIQNQDILEMVNTMMESLNAIVYVVILCAGLLAFIVLYNLTNINITERIREIATIKVLGFYKKEVHQYVFRENIFLTAISAVIGIPVGKILLNFVIDNIRVDMMYFAPKVTLLDYGIAILLTFAFTFIVNLVLRRRLDKVSMTESLKSIE